VALAANNLALQASIPYKHKNFTQAKINASELAVSQLKRDDVHVEKKRSLAQSLNLQVSQLKQQIGKKHSLVSQLSLAA
jgi:hypothetical protein